MRQREELQQIGNRILDELRTELFLSLRIMGPALDALDYRLDLRTRSVGTDAASIRFHPQYLMDQFLEHPRRLMRCYLHMLLHCLFRHPFARESHGDSELYDLCADLAVEALLETIRVPCLEEIPSDFRESTLRELTEEVQALTAERLYRHFTEHPLSFSERARLMSEFARDDHSFWEELKQDPEDSQSPPGGMTRREQDWKDRAKSTRELMAASGPEASGEQGSLSWLLSLEQPAKTDYREYLRRFMTLREEIRVDPDSFDYGYYHFGLEMYGNMPLIEENEFRETVGIDELVIAIDTSGSTRPKLVREFLRETAAILASSETFFHRVHIHLVECDNQIQRDLTLTDVRDLTRYAEEFALSGGMGTDFRPVFRHVRQLQRRGELTRLRGLLYFTDGFGTYPSEPTPYDTAFIFCTDAAYDDRGVPDWALRLYAGGDALNAKRPSPTSESEQ